MDLTSVVHPQPTGISPYVTGLMLTLTLDMSPVYGCVHRPAVTLRKQSLRIVTLPPQFSSGLLMDNGRLTSLPNFTPWYDRYAMTDKLQISHQGQEL